jgi:gliding motility-associated lipoprotein GldD
MYSFYGCRETIVPKPTGYFRIDLPPKGYRTYDTNCPFVFEYPLYSRISYDVGKITAPCWLNIDFPNFNARIHISYNAINNNLESIMKESYNLTYSHSIKADAINEQPWINKQNKVYGILYDLKGNTASSIQFFLTDSIKHYLRGSLYFSVQPNEDSLSPVIQFLREDIIQLIETFKWKNQ